MCAMAGNRTQASRVAGDNSTTEPPMLTMYTALVCYKYNKFASRRTKKVIFGRKWPRISDQEVVFLIRLRLPSRPSFI